ncbi:HNH endonuclease [Pseudomonas sp. Marseille-QA0892]
MTMTGGSLAIAEHAKRGKALHLFRSLGKGKGHLYLGEFACAGWAKRTSPDRVGNNRETISFLLVRVEAIPELSVEPEVQGAMPLLEARLAAVEAASPSNTADPAQSQRTIYKRSEAVRRYVLMRANGICESCGAPAPFQRADWSPYLEPHHINRISDGGLDHPNFVGAVCPACHREVHFGSEGTQKNDRLRAHIEHLERSHW